MSDDKKTKVPRLVFTGAPMRLTYRRMTLDELREAMERPLFPGQGGTAYAVAHTLLAEIDRLGARVVALETHLDELQSSVALCASAVGIDHQ